MGKGLPRSTAGRSASAIARAPIVKKTIPFAALALSFTGASGNGWATAPFAGLPEGNILLLGCVGYVKLTKTGSGITATFDGNYSVGSSATADATLSGTDVDILPSTAYSAAVAGVTALTRATNATAKVLDNTDATLKLNLNVLINDASISADVQAATADGYVTIAYIELSDD
jgi:hypothetical protein